MGTRLSVAILFFVFLSLLIYINQKIEPFTFFEDSFQTVFSSPKAFLYSIKANFGNKQSEIQKLKDENRRLAEKIVDYENLKKDNLALRSQFEETSINRNNLMSAKVVGFLGVYNAPKVLIIDKGKKSGVKKEMTVLSGKHLVGKVGNVSSSYSQVILPVSKQFKTVGKTVKNVSMGIINGEDDFILFDQVVIEDTLEKDDIVVTRGELKDNGLGVKNDLIVGKISAISKTENKPFQNAKITPLIDYSRLTTVFVMKN